MKNYKPSFTFTRNIDNKITARSIQHFVLPFDLNSEEIQEQIFKHLLNGVFEQQEVSMDTGGINVTTGQFEDIVLSFDGVTDRNVAKAIFEYLNKIGHYSFNDDGNVMILEEIDDNILDQPRVLQKWVCFYDHLITSTEYAASIFNELYDSLMDRVSNISIDKKAAAIELTSEERELYREANSYLIGDAKLINDNGEYIASCLMSISKFLENKDIFIAAYKSAKSTLEVATPASENDMKYALELTKKVAMCMPLINIDVEIAEEYLSDENLRAIADKYGNDHDKL